MTVTGLLTSCREKKRGPPRSRLAWPCSSFLAVLHHSGSSSGTPVCVVNRLVTALLPEDTNRTIDPLINSWRLISIAPLRTYFGPVPRVTTGENWGAAILPAQYPVLIIRSMKQAGRLCCFLIVVVLDCSNCPPSLILDANKLNFNRLDRWKKQKTTTHISNILT